MENPYGSPAPKEPRSQDLGVSEKIKSFPHNDVHVILLSTEFTYLGSIRNIHHFLKAKVAQFSC